MKILRFQMNYLTMNFKISNLKLSRYQEAAGDLTDFPPYSLVSYSLLDPNPEKVQKEKPMADSSS